MSPTIAEIIDSEIKLEGPITTNDPTDKGGLTVSGISKAANPDAFKNGPPSDAVVRATYEQRYIKGPGFDQLPDSPLRTQLIDYGINSGSMLAIQKLQGILGVQVDGKLGPTTLAAITPDSMHTVNNKLAIERIKMIGRILKRDPSQLKYVDGWLNRACSFIL